MKSVTYKTIETCNWSLLVAANIATGSVVTWGYLIFADVSNLQPPAAIGSDLVIGLSKSLLPAREFYSATYISMSPLLLAAPMGWIMMSCVSFLPIFRPLSVEAKAALLSILGPALLLIYWHIRLIYAWIGIGWLYSWQFTLYTGLCGVGILIALDTARGLRGLQRLLWIPRLLLVQVTSWEITRGVSIVVFDGLYFMSVLQTVLTLVFVTAIFVFMKGVKDYDKLTSDEVQKSHALSIHLRLGRIMVCGAIVLFSVCLLWIFLTPFLIAYDVLK